jgi:hypothetical protein
VSALGDRVADFMRFLCFHPDSPAAILPRDRTCHAVAAILRQTAFPRNSPLDRA